MRKAYRFCLLLYPRRHRDQFADEMEGVFDALCQEGHGRVWYIRFMFAEIAGLIGGAASAWTAPQPAAGAPTACSSYEPQELIDAQRRVDANVAAMVQAIANHQFERARILSNQEREARENLRVLREKYGDELGMSF